MGLVLGSFCLKHASLCFQSIRKSLTQGRQRGYGIHQPQNYKVTRKLFLFHAAIPSGLHNSIEKKLKSDFWVGLGSHPHDPPVLTPFFIA